MRRKTQCSLLVFLVGCIYTSCTQTQLIAGEMTDAELRTMIVSDVNIEAPLQGVTIASERQNGELLVYAVTDNPYSQIKKAALEAISKLPRSKANAAFIQIVQTDKLWESRVKGGPGAIAQDWFNENLQRTIFQMFGIDSRGKDFFDPNTRKQLVQQLQKIQ